MTINLSPDDQRKAEALVASGQFASVEDALHAGLEALQNELQEEQHWNEYASDRIAAGLEDVREGRTIPMDDFLEELQGLQQQKA